MKAATPACVGFEVVRQSISQIEFGIDQAGITGAAVFILQSVDVEVVMIAAQAEIATQAIGQENLDFSECAQGQLVHGVPPIRGEPLSAGRLVQADLVDRVESEVRTPAPGGGQSQQLPRDFAVYPGAPDFTIVCLLEFIARIRIVEQKGEIVK